jgi:PAS domain S-box-containing protein
VVRSIAGEHVVDEEYFHALPDGARLVVRCSSSPVCDDEGTIVAGVLVMDDVTADKHAEEERPSHFDRLLEETDEEELRAAQRRAETILESITDAFIAVDRDWRFTYVNERALRRMRWRLGQEDLQREDVLGRVFWELLPDSVGTTFEDSYRKALREGQPVEFESYFPPSGEWIECHAYPADGGLSIYYRDISDRKNAEEERETRARQQAVVASLGVRALAQADPQVVMDEAVVALARTLDVEIAEVAEILPGRDELVLRAGVGWTEGAVGRELGPAGGGSLVGFTAMSGQPVLSEDLAADPRFSVSPLLSGHGPVSAVTVAISGRDAPFGVLGAFAKHPRSFSTDDVNFIQAVANVISVAFETARTETRLREVREAERRRIARDLHDEALQGLTQALAVAGRRLSSGDELVGELKSVGQQLRGAIYDLRLEEDESRPLPDRLDAMVAVHAEMASGTDFEVDVSDATPGVPGRRGTEALRIVGEALTNARRHSGASRIRVQASGSEQLLCIEVSDNGTGFDAGGGSVAESAGLRGIRERADLLSADLTISTENGRGTLVRLELSLEEDEAEPDQVRILLVEDHAAVREALAAMFDREPDFTVVGQAGSLAEARGVLEGVDVALLDLGLPDGFGADLITELRETNPRAEALVLSAGLDRANTARAVESGAAGAIDKVAHLDEVVGAVRRLRAGETLFPMDEVVELLGYERRRREQEHDDRQAIESLTPREREVLEALADGLDSQAAADRLHITLRTERNHVANILAKLGVHSRLQALVLCLRYGVVEIRSLETQ